MSRARELAEGLRALREAIPYRCADFRAVKKDQCVGCTGESCEHCVYDECGTHGQALTDAAAYLDERARDNDELAELRRQLERALLRNRFLEVDRKHCRSGKHKMRKALRDGIKRRDKRNDELQKRYEELLWASFEDKDRIDAALDAVAAWEKMKCATALAPGALRSVKDALTK